MKKYTFFVGIFLTIPNFILAQNTLHLKQMRDYFKKNIAGGPYTYLQSPRTGLGVGTIYTIVDGQTILYSHPEECFTAQFLNKAQSSDTIAVENFDKVGKYTWQLGLNIANSGPITDSVKTEFEKNRVYSMIMKIPHLKRRFVTIKSLKDAIDRQMDLECKKVFTSKKPKRWIIIEALYTDQYSLEFHDTTGTKVGINAGILKTLFSSLRSDKETDFKETLQFSDQFHIVAMKAVKIKDIPKYAAGDIQLELVLPDAFYNVIDRR